MQRFAFALLAVLLIAGCGWLLTRNGSSGAPSTALENSAHEAEHGGAVASEVGANGANAGPALRSSVDPSGAAPAVRDLEVFPATRAQAELAGVVVDPRGVPVAGATVTVLATPGRAPRGDRIAGDRQVKRSVAARPDGTFGWRDLPEGPYLVTAVDVEGREGNAELAIAASTPTPRVRITLQAPADSEHDFLVRVVDTAGAPVEGAKVEVVGGVRGVGLVGQDGRPPLTGRSEADGRVVFRRQALIGAVVEARAPDGRLGVATLAARDDVVHAMRKGGLVVTVAAPGRLGGAVTGVAAELCEGARVVVLTSNREEPYSLLSFAVRREVPVRKGHFAFDALPAGRHVLTVESQSGIRQVLPLWREGDQEYANSVQPLIVEVRAGAETTQDLACALGGTLVGTVRDEHGAPLGDAEIEAAFLPKDSRFIDTILWQGLPIQHLNHEDPAGFAGHPVTHLRTTAKKDGAWRLVGLQPGKHRVEVRAARRSVVRRVDVEVQDGKVTTFDVVLMPAGVLQGIGDPDHLVVVRPAAELVATLVARLPDNGEFTLPGLPAGRYALGIVDGEGGGAVVELTEALIEAGRTTFVDLLAFGVDGLQGRLVGARGPLAGATVAHGSRRVATDEQGRFALRLPVRPESEIAMVVEIDTLTWSLTYAARPAGVQAWPGEIRLGPHEARFSCLSADGSPTGAVLAISGDSPGVAPMTGASLSNASLVIGPTGTGGLEDLLPGNYHVRAEFGNGAACDADFAMPSPGPIVLRAPPIGEVLVRVQDPTGAPLAGVTVELEELAARDARTAPQPRIADATEAAPKVADAPTPTEGKLENAEAQQVLETIFSRVQVSQAVELGALQSLGEGTFTFGGKGGFRFVVSGVEHHGRRATTDAEGRARFRGLTPGDYVVRLPPPRDVEKDPARKQRWPSEDTPVRVVAGLCSDLTRILRK